MWKSGNEMFVVLGIISNFFFFICEFEVFSDVFFCLLIGNGEEFVLVVI